MKKGLALAIILTILAASFMACTGTLAEAGDAFYVYRDYASEDNHFNMKAMMSAGGFEDMVYMMNESFTDQPYSGDTCIRCQVNTKKGTWGGWMFLTGMLVPDEEYLIFNDGATPDQGEDLTGMHELRFWARGQNGGESVEFICFGFGAEDSAIAYKDTASKQKLKVNLTTDWQEYVIRWDSLDLSNIVLGFGYACSDGKSEVKENIFYLDEIRYLP